MFPPKKPSSSYHYKNSKIRCNVVQMQLMIYHTNHRVYLKLYKIIGLVMAWPVIMLKLCIKSWNEIFMCSKCFIALECNTETWNFHSLKQKHFKSQSEVIVICRPLYDIPKKADLELPLILKPTHNKSNTPKLLDPLLHRLHFEHPNTYNFPSSMKYWKFCHTACVGP